MIVSYRRKKVIQLEVSLRSLSKVEQERLQRTLLETEKEEKSFCNASGQTVNCSMTTDTTSADEVMPSSSSSTRSSLV